jgi:hypothetical protein
VILVLVLVGLVVLFAVTIGVRRHGESPQAHPSWHPTPERFVDPGTGRKMRVYVDQDGTRHYVPEG